MTPEERARAIANNIPIPNRKIISEAILTAIAQARAEAIEEAAKVADDHYACSVNDLTGGPCFMYGSDVATAIRSLKGTE